MKPNDLTYRIEGMFVAFTPETREGRITWRQLADQTGGTGKILRAQLPSLLATLKRVGIRASKSPHARMASAAEIDELARELASFA